MFFSALTYPEFYYNSAGFVIMALFIAYYIKMNPVSSLVEKYSATLAQLDDDPDNLELRKTLIQTGREMIQNGYNHPLCVPMTDFIINEDLRIAKQEYEYRQKTAKRAEKESKSR